jgi:hypothetical protein
MTTLQVFDRPMCCSTGICGPKVDPVLPRFAADLDWLRMQGIAVDRYNLAQQPSVFTAADIKDLLRTLGDGGLPIIRVNGSIVSTGAYPSREQLARWCGVEAASSLPVMQGCACGTTGCC